MFVLVFPIVTTDCISSGSSSAFLRLPRTLTYCTPLQASSRGKRDFPEGMNHRTVGIFHLLVATDF